MTLLILAAYLLLVLAVGLAAGRLLERTGADYFAASQTIGPFVLLMSLFGTHMTAFSLLGASGEAYHRGFGVFALMASSSALVVPVLTWILGPRIWDLGRRHGYVTQVELFRDRWESPGVGLALFFVLSLLLVPYLLIGVMGGGITLAEITGGQVPPWVGSLVVSAVVLAYVLAGGIRGAAWANTFQTLVFMTLGAIACVLIVRSLGGLEAALDRVDPSLLVHGDAIPGAKLVSYTLIPVSVAMFPHLFMHWLTAKKAATFKLTVVAYPLCLLPVWIPSVLLGVLGSAAVPGLEGPQANSILVTMIEQFAPEVLAGLLGAGVFAAVMSSLDSQVLALSTLVTRGVVKKNPSSVLPLSKGGSSSPNHGEKSGGPARGRSPFGEGGDGGGFSNEDAQQVRRARWFVAAIVIATFLLSLVADRSLFRLGIWSFTGFAALSPLIFAALFWKRSTKVGAYASIVTTVVLWCAFFFTVGDVPGYSIAGTGLMPVVVLTAASAVALVVGSLLSTPPSRETLGKFFPGEAP